jgi:hypothetical protein
MISTNQIATRDAKSKKIAALFIVVVVFSQKESEQSFSVYTQSIISLRPFSRCFSIH